MGPPLIFFDAPLLAFTGVASLAGHALFTAAYGQAPASLQAPFNYFHIAWAVLLGWLVFRHAPESLALSGMALIAKSGERSCTGAATLFIQTAAERTDRRPKQCHILARTAAHCSSR